jgi:hypothetical protein
MQLCEVAKELAHKSIVSRTLGGVIKAGQYADWAKDYKALAQEHYAELEQEKQADWNPLSGLSMPTEIPAFLKDTFTAAKDKVNSLDVPGLLKNTLLKAKGTADSLFPQGVPSLLQNALIGGGAGAGLGALGGLMSKGKLKRKIQNALNYGLLGGLGGAGAGFGGTLLLDKGSIKQLTGPLSGDTPETASTRSAINASGVGANSTLDMGAKPVIGGILGHRAGKALDKALGQKGIDFKRRILDKFDPKEMKYEAFHPDKIVKEQYVISPAVPERYEGTPMNRVLVPAQPAVMGTKDVELHGPHGVIPKGFEPKKQNAISALISKILYKSQSGKDVAFKPSAPRGGLVPKVMAGAGVLGGLADIGTASATPGQMSSALNSDIRNLMATEAAKNNPQMLAKLLELKKETTPGVASYVPGLKRFFGGVSNERANAILDEIAQQQMNR